MAMLTEDLGVLRDRPLPESLPVRPPLEAPVSHRDLRVEMGAIFLDTKVPGWRESILDGLDLADGKYCVLGQLDRYHPALLRQPRRCKGHYTNAALHLGLTDEIAEHFGFASNGERGDYQTLQLAWEEKLGVRTRRWGKRAWRRRFFR